MKNHTQLLGVINDGIADYCREFNRHSFDPEHPTVRLHEPTFGAEEISAAVECLLSTHVTMGRKVKAFERAFAGEFGHRHGVSNNSGSSAVLLAIAALANGETRDGLKPGDEVIVSALSWSTTVWPLIQHGLVPVIVDIDPETLNMDPNEVERAVGPKTRALMPVHVYGNPCDMNALIDICDRRELILIEDACESMGATYDGRPVGRFGRVGAFSFYFSHHITTLEGGICVTGDDELAETMRIVRAHGWIRDVENPERYAAQHPEIDPRFLFVNLGYNLRMTEVQAAIGMVQLPKLAGFVDARRDVAAEWLRAVAPFESVVAVQRETPKARHSWFGFPLTVRPGAPFTCTDFRAYFERAGIETRPIICGNIALQPGMALHPHRTVGDLKHATNVMKNSFSFANHQSLCTASRRHVTDSIRAFMADHA